MTLSTAVSAAAAHKPRVQTNGSLTETVRNLWPYIWPSDRADLKARVLGAMALLLVANSEQVLTGRYSRRLLTMIKVAASDASADAEWREARRDVVLAIERVADIVWAPSGDSSKGGGSEAGGGGGGGSSVSAPAMPKFAGKNL